MRDVFDILDKDYDSIWDMPPWAIALVVLFPAVLLGGQRVIGRHAPAWLGAVLPAIWAAFCLTGWVHLGEVPGSPLTVLITLGAQIIISRAGRNARRRASNAD